MKNPILLLACIIFSFASKAQIGIGTTTPNSTLEISGSIATKVRTFTSAYTADISDCNLIFTGTSATTLTLPTAVGITGRIYTIKNASSNTSVLTVATTSSQTIDGTTSQLLNNAYQSVILVSNGTNWNIAGNALPVGGTNWFLGGNAVSGETTLGTSTGSNYALPFITNGTERMRITNTGNVGIGTTTFNGTYPEKFLVDAGASGNTNYQNVIIGKGNTNSYAQLNIQNTNTGTAASSDVVATANNGTESINYVDMGINGGGNTSSGVLGGANTAYLYATGNDFAIGNGTALKPIKFFTNEGGTYTEQMRIADDGDVAIGTSTFDANNPKLMIDAGTTGNNSALTTISAIGNTNSYVQLNVQNLSNDNAASSDIVATANNGSASTVYIDMGINSQGYTTGNSSILNQGNTAYLYATGADFYIGNGAQNKDLIFFTNTGATGADGTERARFTSTAFQPGANNTYDLGSSSKRWSTIYSNNSLNTSDARLKKNIRNLNYGLSAIMKMKSVQYNWKDGVDKETKIGFLAQDLRKVIPEVVVGNEAKENLAVNYIELIPVLVNAIKEQQQQIEDLKKRVKALERK